LLNVLIVNLQTRSLNTTRQALLYPVIFAMKSLNVIISYGCLKVIFIVLDTNNILFIDTESNPTTKEPECLTWLYAGRCGIIEVFNDSTYADIKKMWDMASAIVLFNAPYDMGVMSILYSRNSYQWSIKKIMDEKTSFWLMVLFGHKYQVRKIAFFRNMINPLKCDSLSDFKEQQYKKHKTFGDIKARNGFIKRKYKPATPIIDLLKLWSILIDDGERTDKDGKKKSISLKSLIKDELHETPIPYTEANARTEAYRLQDVVCLKKLFDIFLDRVKDIESLGSYTWEQWAYIKTPATFTKLVYLDVYPELPQWKKENDEEIKAYDLKTALEIAYNGGITMSAYRGRLTNTAWVDISGAYSKAIEVLNTDSYLKFSIQRLELTPELTLKSNMLLRVKTNFMLKTINKSFKFFALKTPAVTWCWYDDIITCQNMYYGFRYKVLEAYEFNPVLGIETPLPVKWNNQKAEEKALRGKTVLYQFYKYLSNTSYGIKAQRKPFETSHTNMVIAGMITAKVHRVLTTINWVIHELGYDNLYNDTDSSCFNQGKYLSSDKMKYIVDTINKAIYPFTVEDEGYNKDTYILSLKRYVSERGSGSNKIRLHGKGRYNITEDDIYNYIMKDKLPDKKLEVKQIAANTLITMNQILNIYPELNTYKHPFMFVKDIPVVKTDMETFLHDWKMHIDTKLTFELTASSFTRYLRKFKNLHNALKFFEAFRSQRKTEYTNMNFRFWDDEVQEDFEL